MIVILMGAPGAGKGTQADKLVASHGWHKLSTGDALRKHTRLQTQIGQVAATYMNEGRLVPDEILFGVLREELAGIGRDKVVLLDGFPRNLAQAASLRALGDLHPVRAAIHLDVPREELIARLSGRRSCAACGASYHLRFSPPRQDNTCDRCGGELMLRNDDEPAKIAVRLDVYANETSPILAFYKDEGVYKHVDGSATADVVYECLSQIVANLG